MPLLMLVAILVTGILNWPISSSGAPAVGAPPPAPLSFEENRGQAPSSAAFVARGRGYRLLLDGPDMLITLMPASPSAPPAAFRMRLDGAAPGVPTGTQPLRGRVNYFLGSDTGGWRVGIPTYAKVHIPDVYPGVDVVYYGRGRLLEYDFIIAPGADAGRIGLVFETPAPGVQPAVTLERSGDLRVQVASGGLRLRQPVAYQLIDGRRAPVAVRYAVHPREDGSHRIAFDVGPHDPGRPLVIDPVVEYSTYVGGEGTEAVLGIAADAAGNAYLTGHVQSLSGPDRDAFVTKLDAAGAPVYTTYFGGAADDDGNGIVVDAGVAYIVGTTASDGLAVPGAYQAQRVGLTDAFIAAFNASGVLSYATYLGGSAADAGLGIAVGADHRLYVTGYTESSDFPVTDTTALRGTRDAFVARLNPTVTGVASLVTSRYLGGGGLDEGRGIAVDSTGAAYVAGMTTSTDFPIAGTPWDASHNGGRDVFVTKVATDGVSLAYSTFLGGSGDDEAFGVALVADGTVAVTGSTGSSAFPTKTTALATTTRGGVDAFAAVVNTLSSGRSSLVYSTHLGGSGRDVGYAIGVNADRRLYVAGVTESPNFPARDAVAGRGAGPDAFVAKLNYEAVGVLSLVYSTVLGGDGTDEGRGIAVDAAGAAYVAGLTTSTPFTGIDDGDEVDGPQDGFVTKLMEGDLVISLETPYRTALQGEAITASVTVRNIGAASVGPTTIAFALRPTDKTLGPETPVEVLQGSIDIPLLDASESHQTGILTLRIPADPLGVGFGPHHLIAKADAGNAADEALEANNRARVTLLIRRDGPDLTIPTFTSSVSRTGSGMTVRVTDTTTNIGNEPTDAVSVNEFYISTTRDLTGKIGSALGSRQVPVLQHLETDTRSTNLTIPTVPAGQYYLVAVANTTRTRETNFDNNTLSVRIYVGPDLVISGVESRGSAGGNKLSIYTNTANSYAAPAGPSVTGLYISTTASLDGVVARVGERAIGAFGGRGRSTGTVTVTLPAGLTAGRQYYIVARADDGNVVSELNETNNVLAAPVQVLPDLSVSRLVMRTPVARGVPLTVTNTALNKGFVQSGASNLEISLASAGCASPVASLLARAVPALDPSAVHRADSSITIPTTVTPGTYCLVATVDTASSVTEVSETNNRLTIPITIP
jgi:hypothetical protein